MQFLLISLYAPMASWGDIAVGEARDSWDRPSRSAVLGLTAAALGLQREDQDAHDMLDRAFGIAVRLDAPGRVVEDYHTAQSVAENVLKKAKPATRKQVLEAGDRQTILSRRVYRVDALATIAFWRRAECRYSVDAVAQALRRPAFGLFAGRKCNPLGMPLTPEIVEAASLADAFAQRPPLAAWQADSYASLKPRAGWGREVTHDTAMGFDTGMKLQRREVRRDASPHRLRWQFAERTVEVSLVPEVTP